MDNNRLRKHKQKYYVNKCERGLIEIWDVDRDIPVMVETVIATKNKAVTVKKKFIVI